MKLCHERACMLSFRGAQHSHYTDLVISITSTHSRSAGLAMNPSHRGAARLFLRTDSLGLRNPACPAADLTFLRKGETSRRLCLSVPPPPSQRRNDGIKTSDRDVPTGKMLLNASAAGRVSVAWRN